MTGGHDDFEAADDVAVTVVPDAAVDRVQTDEDVGNTSRLGKRRIVDSELARELVSRGWRQSGVLDGLQWCVTCVQPTVWIDATGKPRHHTCTDLF